MQVRIYNSYNLKDHLRQLGFRFNVQEKCWSSRLEDVKRLLPDEDLTLDAIMGVMPDDKQLASQAPFLSINGTDVEVHNSYSMKDSLRSIGFRFDAARACWVRPVEEVLTLLELPDSYSITLELLTETSKRAGATLLLPPLLLLLSRLFSQPLIQSKARSRRRNLLLINRQLPRSRWRVTSSRCTTATR